MTVTTKPRNLAHVKRDRGYRFTDRDPVLDEITRLITDSGLSIEAIVERVTKLSRGGATLAASTLRNWMNGKTRRPQNLTVTWTAFALGYERKFVKRS